MPHDEAAYASALDYLYSFVDYSLKHSSELARAEFNLARMFALLDRLGDPHSRYPIIHVAGTKGKGSVCALTAWALHAAGKTTGLYTSPHLLDFCERIRIDGAPISHAGLVDLVERIRPAVAQVPKLTTFEITTALAFMAFADANVEAAVVEVGLGGRLDATNVVMPRVSVITALSYDHMAVLGDTLGQIAGEKAGIIKPGVPVVSAPQPAEALEVLLRVASENRSPFTLVGKDVKFTALEHSLDGQSLELSTTDEGPKSLILDIPLLGVHQVENAATAYAALRAAGIDASVQAIREGFAAVEWPARFELARREPPVIFDSAHNQDSFGRLVRALDDYFPGRQVILIFGASEDKNIPGMFAEIAPKVRQMLITKSSHPRALEPDYIHGLARRAGVPGETVTPVEAALVRALESSANDGSIVLSAGSMFVTAETMAAWNKLRQSV